LAFSRRDTDTFTKRSVPTKTVKKELKSYELFPFQQKSHRRMRSMEERNPRKWKKENQ